MVPEAGGGNLHTFAIEKKAQKKREHSTSNTVLSHICSNSPDLSLILVCLTCTPFMKTVLRHCSNMKFSLKAETVKSTWNILLTASWPSLKHVSSCFAVWVWLSIFFLID
jgi:hypothetical protein